MKILKKISENIIIILCPIIFIMMYLFIVYKMPITQLELCCDSKNNWNNDEVFYYKQLMSVLEYGYPRGYFGYNESSALNGTFGAWGPIIFYLYSIPAIFVSKDWNLLLICNMILIAIGWLVFVKATNISWKNQVMIGVGIAFMQMPVRYILSGMTEALGYMLVMFIIGLAYKVRKEPVFLLGAFIGLVSSIFVFTMIRPYGIIFWCLPIILLLSCKKYKLSIVTGLAAVVNLVVTIWTMKMFNAPYLFKSVDLTSLQMILEGNIFGGIQYAFTTLGDAANSCINDMIWSMTYREGIGGTTLFFFFWILFIFLLVSILNTVKKQDTMLSWVMVGCIGVIILAILCLYQVLPGYRHVLILCIGMLLVLGIENNYFSLLRVNCFQLVCVIGLFFIMTTFRWGIEATDIQEYSKDKVDKIQEYQTQMKDVMVIDKECSWDNTLAYDGRINQTWLYAVPDGMGIQFDTIQCLEEPTQIKSKYVMTIEGDTVAAELGEAGWTLLLRTDEFVVYKRP